MGQMQKMRFVLWVMVPTCALAFGLSACLEKPRASDERTPPENFAGESQRVDSEFALAALSPQDIRSASLDGELGCVFRAGRPLDSDLYFFGAGFVDPKAGAQGIVRIDGEVVGMQMDGAGGYDRLASGAVLTGSDIAIAIAVTGDKPVRENPPVAMESPIYEASLTATRGDFEQVLDGVYECGP